jgi:MtrB/PioB family decaheme-associated outer membrane protein
MMPTLRKWILPAAVLMVLPVPLLAQTGTGEPGTAPDIATSNFIDVGARGTAFAPGSDEARFERYRDLRDGPTADLFRYKNETNVRGLTAQADHVGYRDQRYSASYDNYGKLRVSFDWNQIPLFFSDTTATLFTSPSPGEFRIDDSIQAGVQNRTTTLANAVGQAQTFDLRVRRDIMDLRLRYSATPDVDWNLSVRNTGKTGNQPWAGTFGFGDAVELAAPLDTHVTDVDTYLEWSNSRGLARAGYYGSFFRNDIRTLVWDNPQRITDSPTAGPFQGRMALWPNSDLNSGNLTGTINLPGRSHATGYVSIGNWSQNDPLIPFTINSALTPIPLDRPTADAKARVTAMNYVVTSRPVDPWSFSARYRSYDFDNRTPVFLVTNTVSFDTSVAPFASGGTSPYSFKRRALDLDATFHASPVVAFRGGYTHEQVDQTFRLFDSTTENTARLSADITGAGWLTLRGVYEHGKRVGTGFDEQVLDDIGEQVSLRHFDISDRTADRFSTIVQVTPGSSLSLNGMVSVGKEDRPGTVFGLRSNNNHGYSIGVDFVPRQSVSMGVSYEYEKYDTLQASRQANPGPQFDDPTRDWTTSANDKAHTLTAGVDLLKIWPKTDVRVAYEFSRAESVYVYGLAPNSTLPPVTQLSPVINEYNRVTADARYYLTRHLGVGAVYLYERYRVDDFAQSPETLNSLAQPSFLILGYIYRPYTANSIVGRLTYLW